MVYLDSNEHDRSYAERREAIYGTLRAEGTFTWDSMYGEEYALAGLYRLDRTLHQRMHQAADRLGQLFAKTVQIVQLSDDSLLEELGLPRSAFDAIRVSLDPSMPAPTVVGRFDFAVNGQKIKMLEFNSDTPTGIVEAFYVNGEVCRAYGAEDPNADCWSAIKQAFGQAVEAYRASGYSTRHIIFSALDWHEEDAGTTRYLLRQSGLASEFAALSDLRVMDDRLWVQQADGPLKPVDIWYRLHALEKLAEDRDEDGYPTGEHVLRLIAERKLAVINPPSGFTAQTKALQALIWNLHEAGQFYTDEEHEWIEAYMLPTYLENRFADRNIPYVVKPIYGREGSGVSIIDGDGHTIDHSGEQEYMEQPMVYQQYIELPSIEIETLKGWTSGRQLWGCFLIGGRPSAVISRVGGHITNNISYYLPSGFWEEGKGLTNGTV
ncbi:glutathionylspermidine synthase family protein [Paenibacillus sp. NPDC056579]|uniref:glutathionylspermidine synthase family protein n=1 Tax=unclassified Paenibacillus TaxID=185978 RepID=UPI001EF8A751|nr:glutathionylspermidine synthase family protein [Paenibacillus sp. H1-7]ULL17387.1 glutathionylspermidine synthase [Paenibacillus sp. H1-7]